MKFTRYIKDRINYILGFILFCIVVIGYLHSMQINNNVIIIIIMISVIFCLISFFITYYKKNKYIKSLQNIRI